MTGFCGWVGPVNNRVPPDRILSDMASGLARVDGHDMRQAAGPDGGLCLNTWPECGVFFETPELCVALEGYPSWSPGPLAALAKREGHGAALAAAYREHGVELLQHLHGPVSLAVLDRARGAVLLAVDRLGIQPLCYAHVPGRGLVFGSRTDAVRAHPAVEASISAQAVHDFLTVSVIPAPGTIYREQSKLCAAQYLFYDGAEVDVRWYWRPPYAKNGHAGSSDLEGELLDALRAALESTMAGEDFARTGAFLSGGLDSTTVCGLLSERSPTPPRSFTIGFDAERYDETPFARVGARHFNLDYNEYRLHPRDALDMIPALAEVFDEPFANSSALPAYYCARQARDAGVTLMLAGDGGDEIFAGNARYVEQGLYEFYARIPRALRGGLIEPLVRVLPGDGPLRAFHKARNYVARSNVPLPDRLFSRHVLRNTPLCEVFEPDTLAEIDDGAIYRSMSEIYHRTDAPTLSSMLLLDLQITLADNDLRKVGRMCERAGVRVKYPMLDEALVEFAARIPASLLIRGRKLRDFYRTAMAGFLPPEVLQKRKHGFGMPFNEWMRDDPGMRALAYDSLTAFRKRGWLKPSFIDRVMTAHRTDSPDTAIALTWDIMVMELWLNAH